MTKGVFIATIEPHSGKSIIILGLMNVILSHSGRVGYFKPVLATDSRDDKEPHIQMILTHFSLPFTYEEVCGFTRKEIADHLIGGSDTLVIETFIEKYQKIEAQCDYTIVEGTDYLGKASITEFEGNVAIPRNLGIPAIIVVSGEGKTLTELKNGTLAAYEGFEKANVEVLAIVANKVRQENVAEAQLLLRSTLPEQTVIAVIPDIQDLNNPTFREVNASLGAKVLFGHHRHDNQVDHTIVGAMHLSNFLNHLKNNTLVVAPGDRSDIIIGVLMANHSRNYPIVAGMLLTGGLEPEPSIVKLIEGLQTVVPISAVSAGTFETAVSVGAIHSQIYSGHTRKIDLAIRTFDKFMDMETLGNKMLTFKHTGMTPYMFQYNIVKRAKSRKRHIVLPEGNDDRILTAAARLIDQDVVDLTLIGDRNEIIASAMRLGIHLDQDKIRIVCPVQSEYFDDYVQTLYNLRKEKNVTLEMARDLMTDVSYFGTMMVYKGHADGMVSGAVHTTQHTIRPALQFVKTKPGISVVSSIFFMCLPDRVSVFGDCAVNPNPTAEELAEIAISSADSAADFGIEPKVAMLSYSSGTSGQGADVERVRKATEIVKQKRPDLKIAGPIQYDAAVDPAVGKQKMPGSDVAGQASVLIFPDLNTGNNTYKAVQRETGALAIGPMLQGLNKPVNDLSRGCTVDDIFNTVVITAIQSQEAQS
ncbi:MAG: Phosphate acetyltransferase [Syntrophus sp. SKADARSKE-3]|nr:Phosphate acetyltransferase [Syntrophus sp. SKADARSKE-3]